MKKLSIFTGLMIVLLFPLPSSGYMPKFTHRQINENAANKSSLDAYLKNYLGFPNGLKEAINNVKVIDWLKEGGTDEDNNIRGLYHFHDPLKTWSTAGILGLGFSALDWSQNNTVGPAPTCEGLAAVGIGPCPEPPPSANPTWSWPAARQYFYQALTSGDPAVRGENYAKTFLALGHMIHLLADMAVPEHARNDQHMLFGSRYEEWGETNLPALASFVTPSVTAADYSTIVNASSAPGYVPISNFWDTQPDPSNNLTLTGLAEYTNFNFVSADTIFEDYAYPLRPNHFIESVIAEDGVSERVIYFSGTTSDGKPIDHLASTGYTWAELSQISAENMNDSRFKLDDNCYKDHANILVPKAVSYNASLLNYFFRGNIEITLPDTGVYAQASNIYDGFSSMTVRAKNITANGDEMTDGDIQLIIRYREALRDPFLETPVTKSTTYSYIVSAPSASTHTIPKDSALNVTFNLETPLPYNATDVTIQVVYHGRLGNEDNAVAVGYKDISEPTPIDIYNDMGMICLNQKWYTAGSPEAIAQVSPNEWDIYPHDLEVYIRFSPEDNPQNDASVVNNFHIPLIPGAVEVVNLSRKPAVISDYTYHSSFYLVPSPTDPNDSWQHLPFSHWRTAYAIKNQTEYNPATNTYTDYQPLLCFYRDGKMFFDSDVVVLNSAYPVDTWCSFNDVIMCP